MKAASVLQSWVVLRKVSNLFLEENLINTTVVIVDSSVWPNHLRQVDPPLEKLLLDDQVMCHPFVFVYGLTI